MQDFRNLKVWQKAHALTLAIYRVTTQFPIDERFGFTMGLRRAAAAVPINLAEGCGRGVDAEFRRSLLLAMGSGSQLEYQLILTHDLGYLTEEDHQRLTADVVEVKRMLAGLIHSVHE
jgi:four helix bundle protein